MARHILDREVIAGDRSDDDAHRRLGDLHELLQIDLSDPLIRVGAPGIGELTRIAHDAGALVLCLVMSFCACASPDAGGSSVDFWALGSEGRWVTMGIRSDGSYGIPEDTLYGFPCTCTAGNYEMVKGLDIDAFSRERMDLTLKELTEEREGVKDLLS